ncbi:MAG: hypothetical protein QMB72_01465, partial [Brachymonas denitrificans]|uniref:hypothetical protein n=1 Tax=Brachymonas denitrificans TaxID=28220 RepID=UPI00352F888B
GVAATAGVAGLAGVAATAGLAGAAGTAGLATEVMGLEAGLVATAAEAGLAAGNSLPKKEVDLIAPDAVFTGALAVAAGVAGAAMAAPPASRQAANSAEKEDWRKVIMNLLENGLEKTC